MSKATLARFTCPNCHVITDLIQNPDAIQSALAAERRVTVERLREAYVAGNVPNGSEEFYRGIDAASWVVFSILDAEAAR